MKRNKPSKQQIKFAIGIYQPVDEDNRINSKKKIWRREPRVQSPNSNHGDERCIQKKKTPAIT